MKAIIDMAGLKKADGIDVSGLPSPERGSAHPKGAAPAGIGRRLAWFALFWLVGVASVGTVALLLRTWIGN